MTRSMLLSRARLLALVLAAVVALVAWQLVGPRPATANVHAAVAGLLHINMKVTGPNGVVFKGEDGALLRNAGLITVIAYHYELNSPYVSASGLPTGTRQHSPVMITHEMGGSSPQFLFAGATHEKLTKVVINFYRSTSNGVDSNYYRVTLTDAYVGDVRQYSSGNSVLEDVSFTFRGIRQDDFIAKTNVEATWVGPLG
jgi:type VI secretion system secreted protein Hcp